MAEALRRSTVQVITRSRSHKGNGSGVSISGGRVLTNAHVIHGRNEKSLQGANLIIESWEGKSFPATLLASDPVRDIALLSAPRLEIPPATLGDSTYLRPGAAVVAVGNPLGFTGAVSSGIIHSVGPVRFGGRAPASSDMTYIHADVRLAPGNSGGPLATFDGKVVGINTMVLAGRVGRNRSFSGGLAIAIPSRSVQTFLSRVASGATLGVTVHPVRLPDKRLGLMVLELTAGGPAEAASLLPGDIFVGANHAPFRDVDDLHTAIVEGPSIITLSFLRGGRPNVRHVAVRLATRPLSSAA